MDRLWSEGWRHFGPLFYRYAQAHHGGRLMDVRPLRIDLARFQASRSQRRVHRKNADLNVHVQPPRIDDIRRSLFHRHKERFVENVPESLEDFLGAEPSIGPCLTLEVGLYTGHRLVAASYMDVGATAVSSIYAFFDPVEESRSLGIATMLAEMAWARDRGCQYYYPGYAYTQPSHYDYKKQFHGLESYDWEAWRPHPRVV
jgi:arginine-tRNA-protein transferase